MGRIFKNYTVKHKCPTSRQRVSFQRLLMLFVVLFCFCLFFRCFDNRGFRKTIKNKNRTIGENIRLIDSIIKYASTKQIPGLLLFIDFEKAFDSIEWLFIERTLNRNISTLERL